MRALNLKKSTAVFLVMVLTVTTALMIIPAVKADVTTSFVYFSSPSVVTLGQSCSIVAQISPSPPSGFVYGNITFIIVDPTGSMLPLGPFISDASGYASFSYAPYGAIGTYTAWVNYPGGTINEEYYLSCDGGPIEFEVVENQSPVAYFNYTPYDVEVGEAVNFYAGDSYDPDGTVASWDWNFGDGHTDSGVNVEHSYSSPGVYNISLMVTDDDGATDTISTSIMVTGNQPPEAFFYYFPSSPVEVDEVVTFDAAYSYDPDGYIFAYFWQMGDGTTYNTSGTSVTHSYSSAGYYTVSLMVVDNEGATDTVLDYITVEAPNQPPVALIYYYASPPIDVDENILFGGTDSYDPDGTIVSYYWEFGDESYSSAHTVYHSYSSPGNYAVSLTVTDDDGATDTYTIFLSVVENQAPVASFISYPSYSTMVGDLVDFDASDSYDPDGTIVSWEWNFGDGNTGSGEYVDHSYSSPGVYTISLTVTDNDGTTDTTTNPLTVVENTPPEAYFTYSPESPVDVGETVSFDAYETHDPDGYIVYYYWEMGDGTTYNSSFFVTHSYSSAGAYTVSLTVADDNGATDTYTDSITVGSSNQPPTADFSVSPSYVVDVDEAVTFDSSGSYDPDGYIVSWTWDFGDGNTDAGQVVSHSYSIAGAYTVHLTVTDNDGATDPVANTLTVTGNTPPVAFFSISPSSPVDVGEVIYFDSSGSYDPDGTIVSYSWDLGDGTFSSAYTIYHSYSNAGSYTVSLTVTDNDGLFDAYAVFITVEEGDQPPVADAGGPYMGIENEPISFNGGASYDNDGSIVAYSWDFGDGTTATGAAPTHSYAQSGNYTVTLTVTDNDGLTGTATATATINEVGAGHIVFDEAHSSIYTIGGNPANVTAGGYSEFANYLVANGYGVSTINPGTTIDASVLASVDILVMVAPQASYSASEIDAIETWVKGGGRLLLISDHSNFGVEISTIAARFSITLAADMILDSDEYITNDFWVYYDSANLLPHPVTAGVSRVELYASDGVVSGPADVIPLIVTDSDGTGTWDNQLDALGVPVMSLLDGGTAGSGRLVIITDSNVWDSLYDCDGDGELDFYDSDNEVLALNAINWLADALNEQPVASFTYSPESPVYVDEDVSFDASGSSDSDGTIVSYLWEFGDGNTAYGESVSHAYSSAGNYTVSLTVTDDDGATDTITDTITVEVPNQPPMASFSYSSPVNIGETVSFDASGSTDPDGTIVSYLWEFGDGNTAYGESQSHSYSAAGDYTVTLTVTDEDGDTGTATATVTVEAPNQPPVASFLYSPPYTVTTGETVIFDASGSTDPDGTIISYYWTLGDGTTSSSSTVHHSYSSTGEYTVTLTVTDDDGATDTATATVTVTQNQPPVADAGGPYTGTENESISFNGGNSYDSDGSIVAFHWSFGDGQTSTSQNPTHTYSQEGAYTITLTVTDNNGATGTDTTTATVTAVPNQSPTADAGDPPSAPVDTGKAITFDASQSSDPDGTITSYYWQMGDGTTYNTTTASISHSYSGSGVYTITLTVTDNEGATDTTTTTVTIGTIEKPPNASFTLSSSSPEVDETVNFDASGSTDPDGTIVSYLWEFGDGNTATGKTVTHSYSANGTCVVTLTVTDNDGLTDTATKSLAVTLPDEPDVMSPEPEAGDDKTVEVGSAVPFDARASTDNVGIVKYEWDFGDGSTETDMTPTHTYTAPGTYTVTLTVEDEAGNTKTDTCLITVESPETGDTGKEIKREPRSLSSVAVVAVAGTAAVAASAAVASSGAVSQAINSAISGLPFPDWLKDFLQLYGKDAFETVDKVELAALERAPLITKRELMSISLSVVTMTVVFSFVETNGLPDFLSMSVLAAVVPYVLLAVLMDNVTEVFAEALCARACRVYRQVNLWVYGLGLFLVSSLVFRFPAGSPIIMRYQSEQISDRKKALIILSKSLILLTLTLPFAGLYMLGFTVLGDAGMLISMMSVFYYSIPIKPVVGKVVYDYKKSVALLALVLTGILFFTFVLNLLPHTVYLVSGAVSLVLAAITLWMLSRSPCETTTPKANT